MSQHPQDVRDISEADPVWLKGKGDDFFRAGDYRGALNAYDASLQLSSDQPRCLSNRAACYLALGRSSECADDCTKALGLLEVGINLLLKTALIVSFPELI